MQGRVAVHGALAYLGRSASAVWGQASQCGPVRSLEPAWQPSASTGASVLSIPGLQGQQKRQPGSRVHLLVLLWFSTPSLQRRSTSTHTHTHTPLPGSCTPAHFTTAAAAAPGDSGRARKYCVYLSFVSSPLLLRLVHHSPSRTDVCGAVTLCLRPTMLMHYALEPASFRFLLMLPLQVSPLAPTPSHRCHYGMSGSCYS